MAHSPNRRQLKTITILVPESGREKSVVESFDDIFATDTAEELHVGSLLIQQAGGLSFIVSEFADADQLERWRLSHERRQLMERFERKSLRELETIRVPFAKVSVPSNESGPKWKIAVSNWIVTYPALLVLNGLLYLITPTLPLPVRLAITSLALTCAVIWIIAPLTKRITRVWRLRDQHLQVKLISDGERD